MPIYPPAHVRVSILGDLVQQPEGGSEIFEFGFADNSGMTTQAVAEAAAPVVLAHWEGANLGISTLARLTGVRAEQVAADGKVSNSYYEAISPTVGDAPAFNCTILSSCVTLETSTAGKGGRHVRGRFYPPGLAGTPMGATVSLSDTEYRKGYWAQFLAALNTAGLVVAVASTTGGGQIANVTGVSLATVVDTVRRRRNHVAVQRTSIEPIS